MTLISRPLKFLKTFLRQAFSPKIEDSVRLRILGLVSLWLAVAGLLWSGATFWPTMAGGLAGTLGYWTSWKRRRSRSWHLSLAIAALIIGVSFLMRSQMLEALTGNWLPLGQFLVMVHALSSFDVRTRGGLYTGLALSGIVLFFGSQQAFDPTYGIFLMGFVVLLLAFLSVSFLEDGMWNARVYWERHQPSVMVFWVVAACAVFSLSWLAFWVMPRGETTLGVAQVAILPLSSNALDGTLVPVNNPRTIPPSLAGLDSGDVMPPDLAAFSPNSAPGEDDGESLQRDDPAAPRGQLPRDAFTGNVAVGGERDVVMYVRSKVASYWRGRTLDYYDGRHWRTSKGYSALARVEGNPRLWYNRDSYRLDNRLRYTQTFFIEQDNPGSVFTGYRGVRIFADAGSLQGRGVREGDSYRVVSAHPRYSLDRLRQSPVGRPGERFFTLPPGSQRIQELSRQITQDANSDFGKLERIIVHLSRNVSYDPSAPSDLTSSASMDGFLFEGELGSALDYATATVLLSRASGLPSRLALGYLPGVRDPLSGAYLVRERDAHAWAEVFFTDLGWVPLDSAPRPDITLLFDDNSGVGYLFQGGMGEKAFQTVKNSPGHFMDVLQWLMDSPALWGLGMTVSLIVTLLLIWRKLRAVDRRRSTGTLGSWLAYSPLAGPGRRDLLKLYAQVEKVLRSRGMGQRMPWQTVTDYAALAAAGNSYGGNAEVQAQLAWFTRTVWEASYNPNHLSTGLVAEGKRRLATLKAALKGAGL